VTTRKLLRAHEISAIRTRVATRCLEIATLVEGFEDEGNLGTWRALDKTMSRALADTRDYIERDRVRRNGGAS
jgi:hypothetical protein